MGQQLNERLTPSGHWLRKHDLEVNRCRSTSASMMASSSTRLAADGDGPERGVAAADALSSGVLSCLVCHLAGSRVWSPASRSKELYADRRDRAALVSRSAQRLRRHRVGGVPAR